MKIVVAIYILFGVYLPSHSFSQVQIPSLKNSTVQYDNPITLNDSKLRNVEISTSKTVTIKGGKIRLTKTMIEADEIIFEAPTTKIKTRGQVVIICHNIDLNGRKLRFRKRFPFIRTNVSIEYSDDLTGDGLEIYKSNYQRVNVTKRGI